MNKKIFPLLICATMILSACDNPGDSSSDGDTSSHSSESGDTSSNTESEEPDSSSSDPVVKLSISGFALPSAIVKFNATIASREDPKDVGKGTTIYSEDKFFATEDNVYKVGDDNPFVFLPEVEVLDENLDPITLTSYHSVVVVDILLENQSWHTLGESELDNFVSADNQNSTFDFKDAAVGETFKLHVSPDANYYTVPAFITEKTLTVTIVDGWNVNTVAELSMLDNSNPLWDDFKTAHGLDKTFKPNGIILHNDIKITANDIPAGFLYTVNDVVEARMKGLNNYVEDPTNGVTKASIVGSLKDYVCVYIHDTPFDGEFLFDGNYFTIDAESLPLVRKFRDEQIDNWSKSEGSHTSLFGFAGDAAGELTTAGDDGDEATDVAIPAQPSTPQGTVVVKNMNVKGNGNRSNATINAGGFIFSKCGCKSMTWENVIARKVFTTFFTRDNYGTDEDGNNYIRYCKGFDSYSSMTYFWAAKNNYMDHTILKRSGGALIICDEVLSISGTTVVGRQTSNLVAESCELESWVNGGESWFVSHNASASMASLTALGQIFSVYAAAHVNQTSHNIVKDGKINLMALLITGGNVFDNTYTQLESTISINNSATPLDITKIFSETPYGYASSSTAALLLQSAEGGYGMFNGVSDFLSIGSDMNPRQFQSTATDVAGGSQDSYVIEAWQNMLKFFDGQSMNLYLKPTAQSNFVGCVLGYLPVAN